MKLFSDQPIQTKNEDILNRSKFADLVANYVMSDATSNGFVMSINGSWGSGKTSIINLIKEKLKTVEFDKANKKFPIIVNYSPWNVTNQDKIIEQFLNMLRNSFKANKVLKIIKKCLKISKDIIDFIPAVSDVKKVIKSIDNIFNKYADSLIGETKDLDDLKEQVVSGLTKSCVKYVVFIDDIDRLNNEEIKLLIQLVKSICNFPNITYVLSFDKTIVAGALKNAQADVTGNKYLEKIVQMEFNVPLIKPTKIQEIIFNDLLEVIDGCSSDDLANIRTYIGLGLFKQLNNMREEKRYINSLTFALECHKDEIDLADLCAITYLRVLDEQIFETLLKYQDYILEKPKSDGKSLKEIENVFKEELSKTKFDYQHNRYLLSHLFPNMFTVAPIIPGNSGDFKRLYHKKKFDMYLQMELDDGDISADRLSSVMELKSEDALFTLAESLSDKQLETFFKLIVDMSYDLKDESKFKTLMRFMLNCLNHLRYNPWNYEFQKEYLTKVVVTNMVQAIGHKKAEKILTDAVYHSKDYNSLVGLYYLITEKEGMSPDSILNSFSESFKDCLLKKAKDVFLSSLQTNETTFKCESRGLLKFMAEECRDDLVGILKIKSDSWIAFFLAETIYIGYSYRSQKTYYCYIYDEDLLGIIMANLKIDFAKLISLSMGNNKVIQRLIAIDMQANREPFSERDKSYFCEDIEKYCKKKSIDFVPSDLYEKE